MMFPSFDKIRMRRRRPPKLFSIMEMLMWLSILGAFQQVNSLEEKLCSTIDIRNTPNHVFGNRKAIQNCTVLEGSVTLSMIFTNDTVKQSDFLRFENLREITGYLLVFQVKGLKSLAQMFPKLRVIGGQQLIMNYALIIFQNDALEEIGLPHLTTIRNGGVRIAENGLLCYAKNIDWQHLISGPVNDLLVQDGSEGGVRVCEDQCIVEAPNTCRHVHDQLSCWNRDQCQLDCPHDRNGTESGPGCANSNGARCHEQCVGGCERPGDNTQCLACRNFIHKSKCVQKCPSNLYAYLNRRCVSENECIGFSKKSKEKFYKPINGKCHHQCPEGWQEDPNNKHSCLKCKSDCPRICEGKQTVDSLTSALKLSKCNIITGDLEIELRTGMDSVAPEKLREAFEKIETIEGYLLIRFSPAFVSLHMFKNLKLIKGTGELFRNKYSVVVFENANLRQLFPNNVTVENGHIQFQNNRMLCYYKIKEWMISLGKANELDEVDQSSFSNGDKAICEESTFNVSVISRFNNGFILQWPAFNTSDMDHRKFLGYQVFFKKVESEDANLSIDDDRSACSDSWDMHFESESDQTKPIRGGMIASETIKANTLYAFYVQTRMVNHPGARNAVSKIGFVRTTFGNPSSPIVKSAMAKSSSEIEISWDPPEEPNGDITHYRITWVRVKEDANMKHVCENDARRPHALTPSRTIVIDPDSSPIMGISVLTGQSSTAHQQTCSQVAGCCECASGGILGSSDGPKHSEHPHIDAVEDEAHFENAIQNVIFVSQKRRKRSVSNAPGDKDAVIDLLSNTPPVKDVDQDFVARKANVTGNRFLIDRLKHYAEYYVSIEACQNTSAKDNYCSQRPAYKSIRTFAIPENDVVANETIIVEIVNGTTSDTRITWQEPSDPNGHILGYRVRVINTAKQSTPIEQCVNRSEYRDFGGGVRYPGLSDGDYHIEVKTITLKGTSAASSPSELFKIRNPGFFTWQRLLIGGLILLFIFIIAAIIIWRCVQMYYGKRIGEFVRQTISANPEYLSQMDVYKQDEWELQRSDLILEEEIGRGTFGKVFRGRGNNVRSQCGEVFGKCAVKTVTEAANSAERLHFLIEASVMKQFNTSFIVKLYGVVSDGQPVLVVMEMMGKGNLRDYLRSRRPDSDENTENLPLPPAQQYYEWAAQIADGMAYLESLKFCHRDLAARNCMVHANETVKIGDFGMARDIYYHEYYKPTGKRLMPVRWMAPESLKDGKFTMKSDVWSYGIVLYEMLTLAQQPYQGLANDEVFNFIGVSRKILDKPVDCPEWWYQLMTHCWRYVPRERPSFKQLVQHLLPTTSDEFKSKSFVVHCMETGELERGHNGGDEPAYVPEGHGHEMGMTVHDEIEDGTLCMNNRADSESPIWHGEGDGFTMEAEDEL